MIKRSKAAAKSWKSSSFEQRRQLLRILLKHVVENQEVICRCALRGELPDYNRSCLPAASLMCKATAIA